MAKFKNFYVWAMNAKFYMGLYCTATVFIIGIVLAIAGNDSIGLLTLVQILLVDIVIAFLQVWLLDAYTDYRRSIFFGRSVLWIAVSVILTVGGSVLFGWFGELSAWCNLILGVFIFLGFSATLLGLKFKQAQDDTKCSSDITAS